MVVAIIGVLVALLLPAVQSVREAARRTQCANNIRQMVLAAHNYESALRRLPGLGTDTSDTFSPQARLLPYLEQANLQDLIDFDQPFTDPNFSGPSYRSPINPVHALAAQTSVAPFLCPSDSSPIKRTYRDSIWAGHNYMLSLGSGQGLAYDAVAQRTDGLFYYESRTRFAEITDGMSNTVFAAEVTRGREGYQPEGATVAEQLRNVEPRKAYANVSRCYRPVYPGGGLAEGGVAPAIQNPNLETLINDCASLRWGTDRAFTWIWGRESRVQVNGYANPNSPIPDVIGHGRGWMTARSWHSVSVNVAMCDGSVRAIGNDIDNQLWRALWSKNGGEVVGDF